jgi:hypothetical protein
MPSCVLPAHPCTISMHARRVRGRAAVLRNTVCAGTIASRNGIAMVAPMPRRTVRLERCLFVMIIATYFAREPRTVVPFMFRFRTVVITSSAFRIWNGTLVTMARTNAEKR